MVVDDVEDDGKSLAVGRIDETRQRFGAAVGGMRREVVEAVVAPVPVPGERRDGHQLDRGDAEVAQPAQVRDHAVEGSLVGERADMQLVEDELLQLQVRSAGDLEGSRVDHARRPAHTLRLETRARIRPRLAVHDEHVLVTGLRGHFRGPGPVVGALQRLVAPAGAHDEAPGLRRPHAKRHALVADRNCA